MKRFTFRSSQQILEMCQPAKRPAAARPGEPTASNWNDEHAAFLAEYNKLIEAEGVALEEFRLL
ncbi:type II toxin-antitoxin system CcdA family antitoxin [Rugamonas sp. CCM 8940]|uniref:type II toxin-antitoxin system CcdA family antitoxin n=1 Tax=Rugamonas sp. CCM 8940 TaxID=2765359 RepID=UPI0018F2EBCA|nr:hypothetical protein [Rugamonas sp. CCM 8940]MBJ7308665.1 hypothetical protein [Rugamonas sp. CCM 8940]